MPNNIPSVLIVSGAKGDTRRYRAFHLYQQLQMAGISSKVMHISDVRVSQYAVDSQILVLHRVACNSFVERLLESVHAHGGLVIADEDDLIFDPAAVRWIDSPDFKDPIRSKLYINEMELQQKTLMLCDGAFTSTNYLAKVIEGYGKPVWVHRNAANLELMEISSRAIHQKRKLDDKYVIGYASGTPTHNRDFALITPALIEILNMIPTAELWVIGHLDIPPVWDSFKDRLKRIHPVPWRHLPFWLSQFDVNLAPLLLDNPFSQSKSEIKYMEAALVGVPTIASPTDAYRFAIQHRKNGLLAYTHKEWQECLNLLADPDHRRMLSYNAGQEISQYTPQYRAQQIVEALNEILEQFGSSTRYSFPEILAKISREYYWPVNWENKPSNVVSGLYSLRSRGVLTLIKQIWVTFRRFLARWIPY